ncbi:hypothetical protein Bwad005_27450 [Bilophila wadsworthia]
MICVTKWEKNSLIPATRNGTKKGRPFGQPSSAAVAFLSFDTLDLLNGTVDAGDAYGQNDEGE